MCELEEVCGRVFVYNHWTGDCQTLEVMKRFLIGLDGRKLERKGTRGHAEIMKALSRGKRRHSNGGSCLWEGGRSLLPGCELRRSGPMISPSLPQAVVIRLPTESGKVHGAACPPGTRDSLPGNQPLQSSHFPGVPRIERLARQLAVCCHSQLAVFLPGLLVAYAPGSHATQDSRSATGGQS